MNWGTGEVAAMTDSPDNVGLDGDGHLRITPRRDQADPARWTSGRVETRRSDFAAPDDGALRIEARLALPRVTGPAAKGYWSAFWALGSSFRDGYVDRTGAGDLDVMEHVNDRPETVGAVHCQPVGGGDPCHEIPDNVGLAGTTTCPRKGCLTGFHSYAVEVHRESSPERIDWLVDRTVYHTVRADQPGMDASTWRLLVERDFFLILNQSIGGGWPGSPTPQTRSGAPLVVDHVAVWVTHRSSCKGHDHDSHDHDDRDHDGRDHDDRDHDDRDHHRASS
jgi:beta-glucanase (GH16 family)